MRLTLSILAGLSGIERTSSFNSAGRHANHWAVSGLLVLCVSTPTQMGYWLGGWRRLPT